ncbi:MAG TPA: acyl-CoA dehydrogenase family protein [Acidimicrobiales bacterium]|nr:acyl-CoA dehydrogenase family protein [Acidimicrobiales bacterium]
MDFELSDDQAALAQLVRAIVAGRFPLERVRQAEGTQTVVDADDWAALGEAGVFSLTLPEPEGAGLGLADAAVVFEELGRGLVPGPLVPSHLAARHLGLEGAADGTWVVGSVRAGRPWLVEHLGALDALVIERDGALGILDGEELDALVDGATPIARSLDPLTPLSRVESPPEGRPVPSDTCAVWVRDHRILTGALCVGIASVTCDLAVAYAKGREQFGRPVGSFQAVKHLCADMLVRAETARAAVQAAAVTVDQPDVGDATRAAAGSALLAAEAALANAKTCIQIHGGMGFTWEVSAHLYLMRTRMLSSSLGDPEVLASLVTQRY